MSTVVEILQRKGPTVHTIAPSDTVLKAVQLMNDQRIGGVVVVGEGGRMVGLFTERDLLRRVVGKGLRPEETRVGDVMTADVIACRPETSLEACASTMTEKRIRHLPVQGPDGLVGIVTIGDLLAFRVEEQRETIDQLTSFVYQNR